MHTHTCICVYVCIYTQAIRCYFLAAFSFPLNLPEPGSKAAQLSEMCTKHGQRKLKEEASDFGVRTVWALVHVCVCVSGWGRGERVDNRTEKVEILWVFFCRLP